jgi:hypothetical protein
MEAWGDDPQMAGWLVRRFTEAALFVKAEDGSLKFQRFTG